MTRIWLALLVAGCAALPDVPEVDNATVYVSIVTPGGLSRVLLSCPQVPGATPVLGQQNTRKVK